MGTGHKRLSSNFNFNNAKSPTRSENLKMTAQGVSTNATQRQLQQLRSNQIIGSQIDFIQNGPRSSANMAGGLSSQKPSEIARKRS